MPEGAVGLWLTSDPGGLLRLQKGSRALSKPAVVQGWRSSSREFAFRSFLHWKWMG